MKFALTCTNWTGAKVVTTWQAFDRNGVNARQRILDEIQARTTRGGANAQIDIGGAMMSKSDLADWELVEVPDDVPPVVEADPIVG